MCACGWCMFYPSLHRWRESDMGDTSDERWLSWNLNYIALSFPPLYNWKSFILFPDWDNMMTISVNSASLQKFAWALPGINRPRDSNVISGMTPMLAQRFFWSNGCALCFSSWVAPVSTATIPWAADHPRSLKWLTTHLDHMTPTHGQGAWVGFPHNHPSTPIVPPHSQPKRPILRTPLLHIFMCCLVHFAPRLIKLLTTSTGLSTCTPLP